MSIEWQQIETAVKYLDQFLKIPELKGAVAKKNKNGTLFKYVGGFNVVFQLEHQNKKWALRVWHIPLGENKQRFQVISNYLSKVNMPYFANFIYDEKGILVNGKLFDTIRMEWLEGSLLKEYLEENLSNKTKLKELAETFLQLSRDLIKNKISHGDLQHENIIIDDNGSIKLIDYDSITVPEITGWSELVTGRDGYQHPSRKKNNKASLKSDYFSVLVIYLSILSLVENNDLWLKYSVKNTEYLLFSATDFEDFQNSMIYKDLDLLSPKIKSLLKILNIYIQAPSFNDLKPFEEYLTPPSIMSFKSSSKKIIEGNSVNLIWEVENYDEILLSTHGELDSNLNNFIVKPKEDKIYVLTVKNTFGTVEKKLNIKVFKAPFIREFKVSHYKIEFEKELNINWEVENFSKVELYFNDQIIDCTDRQYFLDFPQIDTEYKLIVTALDKKTVIEKKIKVLVFKRVKIIDFNTDLNFTIVSLPVHLTWKVENASQIILSSNDGNSINVTQKQAIDFFPKKDTIYYLKASNDLFIDEKQLRITVEEMPIIPNLPTLPKGNEIIPIIDLDIKILEDELLKDTMTEFEEFIENKNKKFSFKRIVSNLFFK